MLWHSLDISRCRQAQCALFAGIFLMSIVRPVDAWRMFLQGLATCQSFRQDSNGAEEESIYWSCWKSEQALRWELGLPSSGNGEPHNAFRACRRIVKISICTRGTSTFLRSNYGVWKPARRLKLSALSKKVYRLKLLCGSLLRSAMMHCNRWHPEGSRWLPWCR